jgi:hypothetical protein
MSDHTVKISIPIWLTAIFGILMIIEFFFSLPKIVLDTNTMIKSWVPIVSAAALILGTLILTIAHLKRVMDRKDEWYYSIIYVVSFAVAGALGLISVRDTNFMWIFNNMTSPIGAALYSLTAFTITSAAFRVFRARNWKASVMLITGFIVLMMLLPVGGAIFPPIVPIGEWIRSFPSSAGFRGMIIGISLGTIGLGVRIFLGRQKEHLGIRSEKKEEVS